MQENAARLAFGHRQPSASITFGSRGRRFLVARADQQRDPGPEIDRIRRMSVNLAGRHMGMPVIVMAALIRERARKAFSGRAVLLGRQTMDSTPEQALAMFSSLNVPSAITDPSQIGIDTTTFGARQNPTARIIRDVDFFRMLGFSETLAIDVSDFEGADIVHDLNQPIPLELESSCDLAVDGSLLDNIFDPTTGLKNIGRLLKPGGRCLVHNMGGTTIEFGGIPYTMFNPLWFFDYFVWNEFEYCQVYITTHFKEGGYDLNDGGVDHRVLHVRLVRDGIKKPFENIGFDPIPVPLEDGIPRPEQGRQVAPRAAGSRDPQHRLDKPSVILAAAAGFFQCFPN